MSNIYYKSEVCEQQFVWLFYQFHFERNYNILKSKSPCILLNKIINFNENETKLKMKNLIHSVWETNLVLQLMKESQIKSKTVMSWTSCKKKEGIFCTANLSEGNIFEICVLSQCIASWIRFQNIHNFTYQKTLLHTLFPCF